MSDTAHAARLRRQLTQVNRQLWPLLRLRQRILRRLARLADETAARRVGACR